MEAIQKGTEAKAKILHKMHDCIEKPRTEKKEIWPVSQKLEVEPHKRSRLLEVGGTNLKKLFLETGVQVNSIDDNTFDIFAPSQSAMDEANEVTTKLLNSERTPDLEFDQRKIAHPSALGLEVGQEMQVNYFGRDPVSGLMQLSRKVLQSVPR